MSHAFNDILAFRPELKPKFEVFIDNAAKKFLDSMSYNSNQEPVKKEEPKDESVVQVVPKMTDEELVRCFEGACVPKTEKKANNKKNRKSKHRNDIRKVDKDVKINVETKNEESQETTIESITDSFNIPVQHTEGNLIFMFV